MQPFRFGAMVGRAASRREWLDQIREAEDLGYSTLFISDHFSDKLAPLPALAMAAEHTSLNLGCLVLANDFRHPAVLAKEAATVDLLSEGRLELGIGTGWAAEDYAASGIRRDPPGVQVDRFEEAVSVLKGLWSPGKVEHNGTHYQISLDGLPKPLGPRLLIGAGARRMLGIAGRHADIIGISAGELTRYEDLRGGLVKAGELLDQKLDWIRAGAGDRFDALELNILLFGVEVGDRDSGYAEIADRWQASPDAIKESPHFLAGSVGEIVELLEERRERWGISYPVVPDRRLEEFAPVVERLTGS
jgi:probable F420-dependent oxidoreductase